MICGLIIEELHALAADADLVFVSFFCGLTGDYFASNSDSRSYWCLQGSMRVREAVPKKQAIVRCFH
jgi:hypothetical protein